MHVLAEDAWQAAGVLSSEKKRKAAVSEAEELGAFIDGTGHYLGGSSTRFLKLLHGTLWMLDQPLLSKKVIQILAGRWVHVMQFRRATMSILDKTWTLVGNKGYHQGIHQQVRREFFLCLLSIPLMHCNLGAGVAEITTASDASSTGGAVGLSKTLSDIGEGFVRGLTAQSATAGAHTGVGHIPLRRNRGCFSGIRLVGIEAYRFNTF